MTIDAPPSRNAPCPCGSGRRYKDCHGAIGAAPVAATPSATDLPARIQALLDGGHPDEAAALVAANPAAVEQEPALALLAARTALLRGDRADAVRRCRQRVAADPADTAAWILLGEALRNDDDDAALAAWRAALAAAPNDAEAHFHIGNLERERGDARAAIAEYDAALAAAPDHPAVLNNLGLARAATGDRDAAAACWRRVLERHPDNVDALANLASDLHARADFAGAEKLFARLYAMRQDLPAYVHLQRGEALQSLWRLGEAEACFRRALTLAPDDFRTATKVAETCIEQGEYAAAKPVLDDILARAPDNAWARSVHVLTRLHLCDWHGIESEYAWLADFFARHPDGSATPPNPLAMMSLPLGPAAQRAAARGWAKVHAVAGDEPPIRATTPGGRLRVGFLSSDLREHALTHVALEHWERLRGGRLETFAYSLLPDAPGPLGERVRRAFDHYVNVAQESATATTERIRADGIAVLFDCNGHSLYARTEVFARRAAPLQINYLGCPATLGAPWWDYILADAFALPPAHERWFDEKPLRMPHSMLPCDTTRAAAVAPVDRARFGLPENAVVLCCFNANYKLLPEVFAIWMRVLAQSEDTVLWLLATKPEARANLACAAQRHGVAPERVVFAPTVAPAENLARHAAADLYLDTFPFGGGTSAGNALLMGLPVLTCAGDTLNSRLAGSQLHAVGLPELVTETAESYAAMAHRLCRDRDLLREFRARLAANRSTAPLFDMRRYSRDFEDVVLQAWQQHPAGAPAAHPERAQKVP